ncbi:hypothetical protein RB195_007456 [Necator americanus]|uniref:Uncharacterized protein n=1 Tax=Necator americanus TaxID=51031 RepID=A0ABR1C0V6_NECAM
MGGANKDFTTFLSATLHRSASREAAYAIAQHENCPQWQRICSIFYIPVLAGKITFLFPEYSKWLDS